MSDILNEFKSRRAKHVRLTEAYHQLQNIYKSPDGEVIYLLVGATGAGKTRLVERLHEDCLSYYQEEMVSDSGFIPSVYTKLVSPTPRATGAQNFDWKDGFIRILSLGNEIQIKKKAFPRITIELDGEDVTEIHGLTPPELRRAVEGFFKGRRLKQLLLDEASHIFVAGEGSSVYPLHFEMLKSLAISLKRPLVLSGAYDLLKALDLNGQLDRRIQTIHFRRYTVEDLRDPQSVYGQSFRDVVYTFLSWIPIPKEEGLIDAVEYFLMKSLGCVGTLKEWFERALEEALKSPNPIFSRAALEKSAHPNKRLKKMLAEIELGEAQLRDIEDTELAKALGFDEVPSIHASVRQYDAPAQEPGTDGKPSKRPKPGKRKPGRDEVGGIKHAA